MSEFTILLKDLCYSQTRVWPINQAYFFQISGEIVCMCIPTLLYINGRLHFPKKADKINSPMKANIDKEIPTAKMRKIPDTSISLNELILVF